MSSLFRGIESGHRALDYHLERQNVLASNVANVETPGFRPLELTREETPRAEGTLPLAQTAEGHLRPDALATPGTRLEVAEERVVNPGNDDNSVSLERELSKLAANHLRYEAVSRVVQHQIGVLRYVANDGNGG